MILMLCESDGFISSIQFREVKKRFHLSHEEPSTARTSRGRGAPLCPEAEDLRALLHVFFMLFYRSSSRILTFAAPSKNRGFFLDRRSRLSSTALRRLDRKEPRVEHNVVFVAGQMATRWRVQTAISSEATRVVQYAIESIETRLSEESLTQE